METPIVYGQVEAQTVNGKHKLVTNLTPRVKVVVNRFEGNQGLYIHINARGKGISSSWEEYVDMCTLKAELDQKLHLLPQIQSQINYQTQSQPQQQVPLQQAMPAQTLQHVPLQQDVSIQPRQAQQQAYIQISQPSNIWEDFA
ncbi:uncharacterized protein LOC110441575 [Mizuhopecten yessoensis]|uniref:uncharacterized protein LOC110441575 n=1 Tax=Mizuhopecten yessoensis TaxID=6573 RepID=UPI000B45C090|nr:uncharacterized protein LOC110441575 [Mizuhopecten yessoensis]